MNNVSIFPAFTSSELIALNYSYAPLTEFTELLNDIYQSSDTDIQRQTCIKFKNLLNGYLGGREPTEKQLQSIHMHKRHFGSVGSLFYETAKRLYKLAKNDIELKVILKSCLNEVSSKVNGKIAVLFRNIDDKLFLESIVNDSDIRGVEFVAPKQLRNGYLNCPLVIIAPSYWFKELLSFPCSQTTFVIQPKNLSATVPTNDVFDGIGGVTFWTSKKETPHCQEIELLVPSQTDYERTEKKESKLSELVQELKHMQPSVFTREVKIAEGLTELIEINRKYITVDRYGSLKLRSFSDEDVFDDCSYIVNEIDYSELSDDDVNIQLRIQMESWKAPLREYCQPYDLPSILASLGAKNAKDYNIKNWKKKDTIRPKDDDDYIALLKFAQIPEEEFSIFFSLAKNIRSNCISIGHRKSEVSRELVAKELRVHLQRQGYLPSKISVGKIKASILVLG